MAVEDFLTTFFAISSFTLVHSGVIGNVRRCGPLDGYRGGPPGPLPERLPFRL